MYVVHLTGDKANQAKAFTIFKTSHFPRKVRGKKDAEKVRAFLYGRGIQAAVTPLKHFQGNLP